MIIIQTHFLLFFIFKNPFQSWMNNLFHESVNIFRHLISSEKRRISKAEHVKLISTVNFTQDNIQALHKQTNLFEATQMQKLI